MFEEDIKVFCVFNKQKIYSYLVASGTVLVLLLGSIFFTGNRMDAMEMSSGVGRLVPIYEVEMQKKRVALTMNCAWNDDDINQILETLDKCNIKITFFMVGDWIDRFPESAKKIAEKGHEIANHSNTHPHVNKLSYEENALEIKTCEEKIKKITGKENKLYRCPYGEYNDTVIKAAEDNGFQVIQWSIDTLDYEGLDESQMIDRINKKLKNRKYYFDA